MGVKGLCSLLEKSQIYEDILFKDGKLLVDGDNLARHLYFTSNLDENHGGEYLAFQAQVQDFFTTLAECGIKPYVLMDGCPGTSDIKHNTIMERARDKVRKACDAALTGKRANILPTFSKLVFEQTLSDMGVPLARCFEEADCQLAALASEWRCPVLSGDSDFCIFDLPAGFLYLKHFEWDGVKTSNGKSIPCKRYTMSRFCEFFKINHQLLPVFASLAGNDYVNLEIQWVQFLVKERRMQTSGYARLEGLLRWLRDFKTAEETWTAAVALMPDMSRQALTKVKTAMLEYQLPSSSLRGFFNEGTPPSLSAEMLSCVPGWVSAPLARGDLSGDVLDLDVIVHKRKTLRIQVECSNLPSSNLTSQHVRQVLYGLLLGQGRDQIQEVDRVGVELISVAMQAVVQGAAQTLMRDAPPQADTAVRLQVCLETLGVKEETLERVPGHLRLPVAVTCYWLRRAKPDQKLLKALLMVMVQGDLSRREGLTTGWQGDTDQISQPLDSAAAHSFNQWQACLKDTSQLNRLLCMPLPKHHLAWLYQGRLVHRRLKQLQKREPEQILHSAHFRSLYGSLLEAVLQPDPGASRRAGGSEAQLTASMGHLYHNTQDEEEEEEKLCGAKGLDQGLDMVSVKTRYRTKDRRNRSRQPELWRKQERKGWG